VPPAYRSVYPKAEDKEHGRGHQRSKEEHQDIEKSEVASSKQRAHYNAYDQADDIDHQLQYADVNEHLAVV
jgi:hypothetical protein